MNYGPPKYAVLVSKQRPLEFAVIELTKPFKNSRNCVRIWGKIKHASWKKPTNIGLFFARKSKCVFTTYHKYEGVLSHHFEKFI